MMKRCRTRYPIAAVRERMRCHQGPVLDFTVGRYREAPPKPLQEMLGNHRRHELLTPCSQDEIGQFAEAAAAMLDRVYGVTVSPTAILAVPGGRTAMSFLASVLIRATDDVAVLEPAYPAFARVADQLGARVHSVPLDPCRGFAPDLEALPAHSAVRFVALNYPNNPTGAVISECDLEALLGLLDPGTIVFNDATYGPLTYNVPPFSVHARYGGRATDLRLLELHSLAKLFSLGPLAVAFLVGDEHVLAELRELSEFAWSDQSSLHIRIALHCLADGGRLEAMRRLFGERMQRLCATLEALGFAPYPVASGMYAVCPVPAAIGDRPVAGAGEAAEVLLAEHGVATVPWEIQPHAYLRFAGQYHDDDLAALKQKDKLATQ